MLKFNKTRYFKHLTLVLLLFGYTAKAQDSTVFTPDLIGPVVGTSTPLDHVTTRLPGNGYTDADSKGFVTLRVRNDLPPSTRYTYDLRMNVFEIDALGVAGTTPTEVTLSVEHDMIAGSGNNYVDVAKWVLPSSYGARIVILEATYVEPNNGGATEVNGIPPQNIVLEIGFDSDSYRELAGTIPNPTAQVIQEKNELQVDWAAVAGAVSYDVEWTWVDGYHEDGNDLALIRPTTDIPFSKDDFERNSTRVQTANLTYPIPLIYSKGYLIYRVRAVGRDTQDATQARFGTWSRGDGNEVTVEDWTPYVFTITNGHQRDKNWQFQASYAEEGKKKEVVSYFDGTLRNRQTVTKINSDENVIVGEVVYDAQGRPAIEVLPVPVEMDSIGYYPNFNQSGNSTGLPYSFQDFDLNAQNVLDNFVGDKAMPNSSGASQYYSSNSGITGPFQARVPNAEGYPFSQIEYMPDNTGRIRRKSGVGLQHQLGNRHEMEYYYGKPEQKELNRLFGYSAGHFSRYKKNLVIDPNRQASVSYIDPQGRTIATALMGATPTELNALDDEADASLHEAITVDLLGKLNPTDTDTPIDNNIRQVLGAFGATSDALVYNATKVSAFDDQLTLSYNLGDVQFTYSCGGAPQNYTVVYDSFLDVLDADGNSLVDRTDFDPANFTVDVERGSYSITKQLVINANTLNTYADEFVAKMLDPADPCYVDPETVYPTIPAAILEGCFTTCADCEQALLDEYPGGVTEYRDVQFANYDFSTLEAVLTPEELAEEEARILATFETQWNELIRACNAPCTDDNGVTGIGTEEIVANSVSCQIASTALLNDMQPTGQYGEASSTLQSNGNGNESVSTVATPAISIFNDFNRLASAETGLNTLVFNSWRNPRHPQFDPEPTDTELYTQGHYYNADGTISYVVVTETVDEEGNATYTPDIKLGTLLIPRTQNLDNDQYLVEPQDLMFSEDFIAPGIWQEEWAESLIVYHPEYRYLEFAQLLCGITNTVSAAGGAEMNSDGYDQYLRLLGTYAEAGGLSSGTTIMDVDPFFNTTSSIPTALSGIAFDLRRDIMQEALNSNYAGSGRSLEDFTYAMVKCTSISECNETANIGSLTTEERDEFWNIYKVNYQNVKQTIQTLFANIYAESVNAYNGCIGEESAPANILAVIADYSTISTAQRNTLNNIIQAGVDRICVSELASDYISKEKRFKPSDFMYDSGNDTEDVLNDLADLTGYELYVQTGLCPLARDLEVFLEFSFADFVTQGISGARTFTGNYLSRALFEDLGGIFPEENLVVTPVPNGTELQLNVVAGELPIVVNLAPTGGYSWNTYGSSWVITDVSNMYAPEITDASQLFTFQAVAQVRATPEATDYEEVIISGTTQARISNCSITADGFNGLGEYLGDGGSAGPLGDCNKEARFTQALVGLLNTLKDSGNLTASSLNLNTVEAYQLSYLNTFFGGISATWTNTGTTYFIDVDGVQRLVLDLDTSLPTSGINEFTGVGLKYIKNAQGQITAQRATVTYLNNSFQKEKILGTLSQGGVEGKPLINFLCCPGEDINDLVGEEDESEFTTCEEGALTLKSELLFNLKELMNALLSNGDFYSSDSVNLGAYPEYNEFLQRYLEANSLQYCDQPTRDCSAVIDLYSYFDTENVTWNLINFGSFSIIYIGGGVTTFQIRFENPDIPTDIVEIVQLTSHNYAAETGASNFGLVYLDGNGATQQIGIDSFGTQGIRPGITGTTPFYFGSYYQCDLFDILETPTAKIDVCATGAQNEEILEEYLKQIFNQIFQIPFGSPDPEFLNNVPLDDTSITNNLLNDSELRVEERLEQSSMINGTVWGDPIPRNLASFSRNELNPLTAHTTRVTIGFAGFGNFINDGDQNIYFTLELYNLDNTRYTQQQIREIQEIDFFDINSITPFEAEPTGIIRYRDISNQVLTATFELQFRREVLMGGIFGYPVEFCSDFIDVGQSAVSCADYQANEEIFEGIYKDMLNDAIDELINNGNNGSIGVLDFQSTAITSLYSNTQLNYETDIVGRNFSNRETRLTIGPGRGIDNNVVSINLGLSPVVADYDEIGEFYSSGLHLWPSVFPTPGSSTEIFIEDLGLPNFVVQDCQEILELDIQEYIDSMDLIKLTYLDLQGNQQIGYYFFQIRNFERTSISPGIFSGPLGSLCRGLSGDLSLNQMNSAIARGSALFVNSESPLQEIIPSAPSLIEQREECGAAICIPPIPAPVSCTDKYPQYITLMNGISDVIAEEGDVVSEADFCRNHYQYLVDDYTTFLSTFGVTSTLDLDYMSIARFGATELNYGFSGTASIILDYRTHVENTRATRIDGDATNDLATMTWAEFTSNYLDNNPGVCVPQPMPVDFSEVPGIEIPAETPCEQFKASVTTAYSNDVYESVIAARRQEFVEAYLEYALSAPVETFDMTYFDKEYQYTLYYYDQAGNLVQTVPPEGVDRFTEQELNGGLNVQINTHRENNVATENPALLPDHELITEYRYNSLNQLVWQKTPDGGETRFAFDRLGRIIASQNAKQLGNNRFSYTVYDGLGRIIEAGEMAPNTSLTIQEATGKLVLSGDGSYVDTTGAYPLNVSDTQYEVTRTEYNRVSLYAPENIFDTVVDGEVADANTRNRVAAIYYYDLVESTTSRAAYDNAMFYNYDIHGNVEELVQHNRLMVLDPSDPFSGMKHVQYEYDLISGNVTQVLYQNQRQDMFAHRYAYDADNRIIGVETSSDGMVWEKDASYEYFAHGPLARAVMGDKEVQGMDYAYTLQGWLKGVNAEDLQPGNDMGSDGTAGSNVAKDALGYSLSYFENDYLPTGAATNNAFGYSTNAAQSTAKNLYNGNIKQMVTSLIDNDESLLAAQMNHYEYDQLNRIKSFRGHNANGGALTPTYEASYAFDRNGNLATLERKVGGGGPLVTMDQLTYHYNEVDRSGSPISGNRTVGKANNQLAYVSDAIGNAGFNDLGNQSPGNYQYDAIGQLVSDASENIANIDWRVDGKVRSVTKNSGGTSTISFKYDGLGNRIAKSEVEENRTTLYVRDAQGNVLAVYTAQSDGEIDFGGGENNPPTVQLNNITITDLQEFKAVQWIEVANDTGENSVEVGGDLNLRAGNYIDLKPNFHAKAGSRFVAEIGPVEGGEGTVGLRLTEQHLYGSSRLGLQQQDLLLTDENAVTTQTLFENEVGDKRYEFSNHLGNVLSVTTDRKVNDAGSLQPDVVAYNDYFPYGMLMPGRHGNSVDYRYGFQGQEMDDEIKGEGNSLNYTFRMHDPRVGRFLSLDPLSDSYAHNSPYAFAENRVIDGIELEGAEYLNKDDAMVQAVKGTLFIKLENFSELSQKNIYKTYSGIGLYTTDETGIAHGAGEIRTFITPQYEALPSVAPDENEKWRQNSWKEMQRYKKKTKRTPNGEKIPKKDRVYKWHEHNTVVPAPKVKGGALAVLYAIELYGAYVDFKNKAQIGEDYNKLLRQVKSWTWTSSGTVLSKNSAIVDKVLADMNFAIQENVIDKKYLKSPEDMSHLFNIILFGGNGNEGKEITELGLKIYNDAQDRSEKIDEMVRKIRKIMREVNIEKKRLNREELGNEQFERSND